MVSESVQHRHRHRAAAGWRDGVDEEERAAREDERHGDQRRRLAALRPGARRDACEAVPSQRRNPGGRVAVGVAARRQRLHAGAAARARGDVKAKRVREGQEAVAHRLHVL